jgi:calcium-dependent protein kinase
MGGCCNRDPNKPTPPFLPDSPRNTEPISRERPALSSLLTPSRSYDQRKATLSPALLNLPGSTTLQASQETIPFKRLTKKFDEKFIFKTEVFRGSAGFSFLAMHSKTKLPFLCRRITKFHPATEGKNRPINQEVILRSELEILGKLNHPNILQISEVLEDTNSYYAISEALTEGTPETYHTLFATKNEALIAMVINKVLGGLAYCHSKNVCHGNLSLASIIFFQTFNDWYEVKITGFGSVRFRSEENLNFILSPLLYTAPEAITGEATAKSDVWSCGIILHYLLSGYLPFYGDTKAELQTALDSQELKFPIMLWSRFNKTVQDLLKGMLKCDPSARLTAAECLERPWFKSVQKPLQMAAKSLATTLENMMRFRCGSKLQLAILSVFVTNTMSREENRVLTECFRLINRNGDSELSVEELAQALELVLDREETLEKAQQIMEMVDLDNNGSLVYSEFLVAACNMRILLNERNIRLVYDLFDQDKNKKVSLRELKATINVPDSDESWDVLMRKVDKNSDGNLNFDEFKKMVMIAAGDTK